MDWNDVVFSDWFGALGSGVVAAAITAVGLPAPPDNPAPATALQAQVQPNTAAPAGATTGRRGY